MKRFLGILGLAAVLLSSTAVLAKSYVSASYKNKYERLGDRKARSYFQRINPASEEGEMTLEEFKSLKLSRTEEKENRQLMKEGKFRSQDEQFKAIDVNKDGKINREEMRAYFAQEAYDRWPSRNDRDPNVAKEYAETPEEKAIDAAETPTERQEINAEADNKAEGVAVGIDRAKGEKGPIGKPTTGNPGNPLVKDDHKSEEAKDGEAVETTPEGTKREGEEIEGKPLGVRAQPEENSQDGEENTPDNKYI